MFGDFQHVMAESSNAVADRALIDSVLALVDGLPDRLRDGIDVADIGCGSGHAANLIAAAFPASRVTGFDISEAGIKSARAEAAEMGLTNARFDVQDAATFDAPAAFDFVTTFDAVHDQADPAAVLRAIARSLRPEGVYLCVDIQASSELGENLDHPMGPFLYTISTMHCMTVSLAEGGAGLGAMWGEQVAHQMLRDAGFTSVVTRRIPGDEFNNYYVARLSD
jgi:SAM-dependent methyltransferase